MGVMGGVRRPITWSPSVTLVPTRACFNACGYCSFRRPLNPDQPLGDALSPLEAVRQLQQRPEAREVLLLSGEVPMDSGLRREWFLQLLRLSRLALAHGRLPHTNAGPLTLSEMAVLGRCNPSMGLMLEGLGRAYGRLHQAAPSKTLVMRLQQLVQAGRLGIPFTTGLLLGVGETAQERSSALELVAHLHRRWGHIQEVILQPWRPDRPVPTPLSPAACEALLPTIVEARRILPPEVHLQLPANLWPLAALPEALAAGIDDLGGIDVLDVINPAYRQPTPEVLRRSLAAAGWELRPRLCVHHAWIPRLPASLQRQVRALEQSLARSGVVRV
ncbi:MAG: 7,8-didemethyl-8-hydroxy-5-deazariboflavin synthase subunit CofG [Cyanobacteriota bacterium]|nr:7,8-didemethyl-8-hydroxy-5-deazariboflavin synthase subunit CofG [Cyanobacteriota bacterium]